MSETVTDADKRILKGETKNSLLDKVSSLTLSSSLVLGLIMLIIGLSLYTAALTGQYIRESFTLARSAAVVADYIPEADDVCAAVMDVYNSMSEEERQDQNSAAYSDRFSEIEKTGGYNKLRILLTDLRKSSDVNFLYIGEYEPEADRLIYICDPDTNPSTSCHTGTWEIVPERETSKFLGWDGKGYLYDIGISERLGLICTSGFPLHDENGDVYAFVLADITLGEVLKGIRLFVLQYIIALAIVIFLIRRYMTGKLLTTVVEPVNSIADAAQQYVIDKYAGNSEVMHFDNLAIHSGDEIEHLVSVMAGMEKSISGYEEALSEVIAEKEREHTEMDLAARIQSNMLPTEFPAFPDRTEFEIYGAMDPAREVGGDFYDFFMIDEDHLAILIADVSGKGIPAALFMMASMIIVGNTAMNKEGYDPAEMLAAANNIICVHNFEDMFVTVWLGILEISTGKLKAANAGHEYPAVRHADGSFELLKDKHGLVLGAMEDQKYTQYELQLEKGSKIFVYTDGVPEATSPDKELFGTDRAIDALNIDPSAKPEDLLKNVKTAIDEFVRGADQFDDLTMLCIEYKGSDPDRETGKKKKDPSRNVSRWVPEKANTGIK